MRIISWNIRQGGGQRHSQIIERLVSHQPDVVVLGEYRPANTMFALHEDLKQMGLPF
jgi:hypothetical protein